MMNWKGYGRKHSKPTSSCLNVLRKNKQSLTQDSGCPDEIRTETLPNTSLEYHMYTNLFRDFKVTYRHNNNNINL